MSTRKPSFVASTTVISEALNDTAYDTVKVVSDNIDTVTHLSSILNPESLAAITAVNENLGQIIAAIAASEAAAESEANALTSETNAATSAEEALDSLTTIQDLTVETGAYDSMVVYDSVTNTITVPRGTPGDNGMTPNYEFIYNEVTGNIEYQFTGYTSEHATAVEEI